MGWKKTDSSQEKGEGIKEPPIILKSNEKIEGLGRGTSIYTNNEPIKKSSGWQKKFLGIPVWGWITIAGVLVWAGIIVGIVMYR
jgi:hypothetical protein